ncbi:MAG TPA: PDDEXK nuclease domain-containing protein, partial [Acidobacteriota bacterium]|nr:PDDEXK nuclease domain-containing protein [Acidobacteriota bacterium]
ERAEYGREVVTGIAQQLTADYGRGFSRSNLFSMMRFAEVFPDMQIVQTLSGQLGWSHFLEIIPINDPLKRDFYAEMCRIERWSVRTLRAKIDGMLFERTAISKNTDEFIKQELENLRTEDRMTPDLVFRDPYLLDFLGLTGVYSEKDLENAILRDLEKFLLELGSDFAFVARQKRINVDDEDFYLDLLFFHRRLRRLVAVELKLGKFMPADSGQMEFYLRYLNRYERLPGEESPLGLILCAGKSEPRVELLELEQRGIRIAEYLTELPPKTTLALKLAEVVRLNRERIDNLTSEKETES